MASDFATIQVSGRLTNEPKVFKVGTGEKVVFTIAVNRFSKPSEGKESVKRTTFIQCVAWDRVGQRIKENAVKGCKVVVTGDWEDDNYTNKDSKDVKISQVYVRNVNVFSANEAVSPAVDNDIPF